MSGRLRRGLAIAGSPAGLRLLARMAGWAVVLPVLKRALPLPRLVRLMAWSRPLRTGDARAVERTVRVSRLLYRSRLVAGRDNCLERSLLALRYLGRAGADPSLVAGVRRGADGVEGHVWVLVDDEPVHDSRDALAGFTSLVVFDRSGRLTVGSGADAPSSEPGTQGGAGVP